MKIFGFGVGFGEKKTKKSPNTMKSSGISFSPCGHYFRLFQVEVGQVEGDTSVSGMSRKGNVDFEILAGCHGEHAAIVEIIAMPSGVIFVENGTVLGVDADVVAFRDASGNTAPTDEGSDEHIVLVDGDLIADIDDKGIVVFPVCHDDMAVIHVVGADIEEVGIYTDNVETEANAQVGKTHVGDVIDSVVADKAGVETDDGTLLVL